MITLIQAELGGADTMRLDGDGNVSHILTEEMLSWRTVVKNGRRSNILRLQVFFSFCFHRLRDFSPAQGVGGGLYTRAGQ